MEEERLFCIRGWVVVVMLTKHTEVCASSIIHPLISLPFHILLPCLYLFLRPLFLHLSSSPFIPFLFHTNRVCLNQSYHGMIVQCFKMEQITSLYLSCYLHTPPIPAPVHFTRARKSDRRGRRDSERKSERGWSSGRAVAIRHMQRQMLCSAAGKQEKEGERFPSLEAVLLAARLHKRHGITGEGAGRNVAGAVCDRGVLALQLRLVFLQNGCRGAHHWKGGEMSLCQFAHELQCAASPNFCFASRIYAEIHKQSSLQQRLDWIKLIEWDVFVHVAFQDTV